MCPAIFIGIGSNLGDRAKNCKNAVSLISKIPGISIEKISKWRESRAVLPIGSLNAPDFINGAAKIKTSLEPASLLLKLKNIEKTMGRPDMHERWSPRTIDLDILFYGDRIIDLPDLKIPHPELHKRTFVLEPMCDIGAEVVHPVLEISVRNLLNELTKEVRGQRPDV